MGERRLADLVPHPLHLGAPVLEAAAKAMSRRSIGQPKRAQDRKAWLKAMSGLVISYSLISMPSK